MPPVVDPRRQKRYSHLRQQGWSRKAAAEEAGVSYSWAIKFDKGHWNSGDGYRKAREERSIPAPVPPERLGDNARRALGDFEFFRRHYLGHISTPWQVETAYRLIELLESPQKEWVVENCPPGVGKSTLITDLGTWVTCRNRGLRGLMGSRKALNGRRQVLRVRRNLERTRPYKPPSEDVEKGLACDAKSTLAADFGYFKPITHADVWRAEEFVVAQFDDEPIEEKEPTWSSYGRDSGVLGNRFDLIFWDDLVDRTNTRTFEVQHDLEEWWDEEAENRLEPGGLLVLLGQRMHANDLYHFCLGKMKGDDEGEATDERQYQRIVYKAHDEKRCVDNHKPSQARAWPDGCLLDPYRLPWRELNAIRKNKPQRYAVLYQQEEGDPATMFVKDEWLKGGIDPENQTLVPGCHDDRDVLQLPRGLTGDLLSIATVDPSPTKMWAIQWWIYAPHAFHQVFLMDLENRAMPANHLLDWNANEQAHYGLMEEWQARSVEMDLKITHWIVEINAAQRFLLAYDHVRRWMSKWGTAILPHSTGVQKLDPDLGVDMIRDHYRFGRVRLPYKAYSEGRQKTLKLEEQLKNYGNMRMDDQVMANWFLFANLPNIWTPAGTSQSSEWRPTWINKVA